MDYVYPTAPLMSTKIFAALYNKSDMSGARRESLKRGAPAYGRRALLDRRRKEEAIGTPKA